MLIDYTNRPIPDGRFLGARGVYFVTAARALKKGFILGEPAVPPRARLAVLGLAPLPWYRSDWQSQILAHQEARSWCENPRLSSLGMKLSIPAEMEVAYVGKVIDRIFELYNSQKWR